MCNCDGMILDAWLVMSTQGALAPGGKHSTALNTLWLAVLCMTVGMLWCTRKGTSHNE
jgi:hypothetical protein